MCVRSTVKCCELICLKKQRRRLPSSPQTSGVKSGSFSVQGGPAETLRSRLELGSGPQLPQSAAERTGCQLMTWNKESPTSTCFCETEISLLVRPTFSAAQRAVWRTSGFGGVTLECIFLVPHGCGQQSQGCLIGTTHRILKLHKRSGVRIYIPLNLSVL